MFTKPIKFSRHKNNIKLQDIYDTYFKNSKNELNFEKFFLKSRNSTELPHLRLHKTPQMRIAEGDNTAQNWSNLHSQESAIVIGPVSLFSSVKCWTYDGGLFRLFKFTDLQPKLGPVLAPYQADCHFYCGIQFRKQKSQSRAHGRHIPGHVSLLPRQTILEVRKLDTALARCCAENKCWRPEFGPELAAKCIPELSFQQRHDIGNRSSANFWRCWASFGSYLTPVMCFRKF